MNSKIRAQQQTKIRKALLRNGYVPLANNCKACYLNGWGKLDVDKAMVDSWSGSLAYLSTGIRIDPPLIAIDIDIDDDDIISQLWDDCVDEFGEDWGNTTLIRYGGGAKETWLCRVSEPFHVPPGPKYVRPGEDVEDKDIDRHKVELFGGGSVKQIGAFGIHTPGERVTDEPLVEYRWADDSPAEVAQADLPELTPQQAMWIVTRASERLGEAGWVRDRVYNPDDYTGEASYDLTDDMEFICGRGREPVPYDALAGEKKCRMREITGEGTNPERGRVYVGDDGLPWVWDSETHAKHLHVSLRPRDVDETFESLSDKLARIAGGADQLEEIVERETAQADDVEEDTPPVTLEELNGWHWGDWAEIVDHSGCEADAKEWLAELGDDAEELGVEDVIGLFENAADLRAMVTVLHRRYAYYGLGKADEEVYDLATARAVTLSVLKNTYAWMQRKVPHLTPTGKPSSKMVHAIDMWLADEDHRQTLVGFEFDPSSEVVLTAGQMPGTLVMNGWRRRRFEVDPDPRAAEVFERFMEHLFPEPEERDWLVNHLAHKVQHPEERGQSVIMVSERGRVGRGTLNQILYGMFDHRFAKNLRTGDLVGESSRWTYWQANCVIAVMDEIIPNPLDRHARLHTASALDDLVDTRPQQKALEDKGKPLIQATVYWTGYFSTNHFNALALPPKDNRFTVLSNTEVRIIEAPKIKAMLESVQDTHESFSEAFLCGVYQYLMSLETDREAFMNGIETEAKMDMITSGEGQVQHALREVLSLLEADEKSYAWLPNIQHEVVHRVTNDYAKTQAPMEVRKTLAQGFCGWWYDPKKPFRVVDLDTGEQRSMKRIVTKGKTADDVSPAARALQLGTLRVIRGGAA